MYNEASAVFSVSNYTQTGTKNSPKDELKDYVPVEMHSDRLFSETVVCSGKLGPWKGQRWVKGGTRGVQELLCHHRS